MDAGIGQRFREWMAHEPIRDGWTLGKKIRAAFNAGWYEGYKQSQRDSAPSKDAKKAFNQGLNTQLNERKLTHRGSSKVLGELYRLLSKLDYSKKRDTPERANIADAINRVKLNYHLLRFLQEKGLVLEFKRWYLSDQGSGSASVPDFSRTSNDASDS